jgi:hypothetical protein
VSPEQLQNFRALLAMLERNRAAAGYVPEEIAGPGARPAEPLPEGRPPFASQQEAWEAIRETARKEREAALRELWELTPPGSAMAAYDAAERGDLPGTIVGAIGAVPGGGALGQAVKGAYRTTKAMRSAWKAAGVADDLPVDPASRARRLTEQGYERGWWRGGTDAGDGTHFTKDRKEAVAYAGRRRKETGRGDMREYAIGTLAPFDDRAVYGPAELREFATALQRYNPGTAADFRAIADAGQGLPGSHVRQILDVHSERTEALLEGLGYDAILAGRHAQVLDRGIVRDANRAAFDPVKRGVRNIFAGLPPVAFGGLIGYGSSSGGSEQP